MQKLTQWIAARFVRQGESLREPRVRSRLGLLEGWVSIGVNLVLAVVKLFLGVALQSAGLISDAVHSLGDMATSIIVIISFRASRKPPDAEHPFGHARAEHIAALVISVLLVVAGFEIARETAQQLWAALGDGALKTGAGLPAPPLGWGLFFVLAGLLLVKELLARFSTALGRIIDSEALKADGWHHRSDALTTGVVIAGLAGRNFGLPWFDSAAGVIVAVFIVGTGGIMAYRTISPLLGETLSTSQIEQLREISGKVADIMNVHDIRVQRYGGFYFTTVHVEVSDRIDVHKMHEITVQLEARILQRFPGECVVHVDPINFDHPLFNRVSDVLREAVIRHPDLVEFHDLSLRSAENGEEGDVEIAVEPGAPNENYAALSRYVEREIDQAFPDLRFSVRLKVDFSATSLD